MKEWRVERTSVDVFFDAASNRKITYLELTLNELSSAGWEVQRIFTQANTEGTYIVCWRTIPGSD